MIQLPFHPSPHQTFPVLGFSKPSRNTIHGYLNEVQRVILLNRENSKGRNYSLQVPLYLRTTVWELVHRVRTDSISLRRKNCWSRWLWNQVQPLFTGKGLYPCREVVLRTNHLSWSRPKVGSLVGTSQYKHVTSWTCWCTPVNRSWRVSTLSPLRGLPSVPIVILLLLLLFLYMTHRFFFQWLLVVYKSWSSRVKSNEWS